MNKRLGQNFLKDWRVAQKMVSEAEIEPGEIVLEIGPGKGILTKLLLEKEAKVIAIEKDKKLFDFLKERFKKEQNLTLLKGDALSYLRDNEFLSKEKFKIVSNIPYYLTSVLFRIIFERKNIPQKIILMIQKEVAQRIVANPPKMNILAISVQVFAKAKILFYVKKEKFSPRPKVDSAVIKIEPLKKNLLDKEKVPKDSFFNFLKIGFSSPRKTLSKNLSQKFSKEKVKVSLENLKIDSKSRPENLSIKEWIELYKALCYNLKKE